MPKKTRHTSHIRTVAGFQRRGFQRRGFQRRGSQRQARNRKGVVTLWTILTVPALMILLGLVLETGHLWYARVELENGLESAALASVKEWGDAAGGSTSTPRLVGVEYAAANTINGDPVTIDNNHDPVHAPNENATCEGDLIFGAITTGEAPYVFNAGVRPSCGGGNVLFDASDEGNLAADDAWGIAYRFHPDTPSDLVVARVEIDLRAGGGNGVFDSSTGGPTLSNNLPPHKIRDNSGNSQPDVSGFTDSANQIAFSNPETYVLRIDFFEDLGADAGFQPGDRIRFGARTRDVVGHVPGADDGDNIGRDHVGITVWFAQAGTLILPPSTAVFVDTGGKISQCFDPAISDPVTGSLIVNPLGVPDLPCPSTAASKNNGQSYVELLGTGPNAFAVRAQATVEIPSFWCQLFCLPIGPYRVSSHATAMYNCADGRPRLIRVAEFICPGP